MHLVFDMLEAIQLIKEKKNNEASLEIESENGFINLFIYTWIVILYSFLILRALRAN